MANVDSANRAGTLDSLEPESDSNLPGIISKLRNTLTDGGDLQPSSDLTDGELDQIIQDLTGTPVEPISAPTAGRLHYLAVALFVRFRRHGEDTDLRAVI